MYRVIRVFLFFVRLQAKQNKKKLKIIIEICMKSKKEGPNRRYCSADYCFCIFQTSVRTRPYHRNMTRAFATCTTRIMTRCREVLAEFFQHVFRKWSLICRTGKGKSTENVKKPVTLVEINSSFNDGIVFTNCLLPRSKNTTALRL